MKSNGYIIRRKSKVVKIGNVSIGGNNPILVQSMTKTNTDNIKATVAQIKMLEEQGCEIIRVAVPDEKAAESLGEIKKNISIPLVADIHFDYKLALKAIEKGADKIRINPGNIGDTEGVRKVVKAAFKKEIPIRIGVNSGSLDRKIVKNNPDKYPYELMVESALEHIRVLESMDFFNIVVSLKASDVLTTVNAYKMLAKRVDYPLHLGVTESGTLLSGTVKSSAGMSCLLEDGIGDTIRVSLASSPLYEVKIGFEILKALGLREKGVELIVCPTCGRCEVNLIKIAEKAEESLSGINKNIKVAIMGCVVNGPGEAKEADVGIACGKGKGIVFKGGKMLKTVPEDQLLNALLEEVRQY